MLARTVIGPANRGDLMIPAWPAMNLDPVQRLRVLGACLYAPMVAEAFLARSFETVWPAAADLERLPGLIPAMREFRVLGTEKELVKALAVGRLGGHTHFDVVLRPGWCLMQSRFVVRGMAAVSEKGGTRFAVLGGVRVPFARLIRPLLGPLGRSRGRRMLRRLEKRLNATES